VFVSSYILYNILQTKLLDVIICANKINEFHEYLYRERDTKFEFLWKSTNVVAQPAGIKRLKYNMVDSV